MSDPLQVVIGYDRSEVAAYHVLCDSIIRHASRPVAITALYLPQLEADNLYWRQDRGSTDFAFSRFLTPYMVGYHGKVAFLDCDMLVRGDIAELFDCVGLDQDVAVCQHDYRREGVKFLGHVQESYPRKLWSAVMVFNCCSQRVKNLTPKLVNEASGAYLHRFEWAGKSRIGSIPEAWHWIPEHSEARVPFESASLIHWTEGGPWFKDYSNCGYSSAWMEEYYKTTEIQVK